MANANTLYRRVRTFLIGGARSMEDPDLFKKISLVALLAWVGLGVGRAHLLLVRARGGLPCARQPRPPRHLRCRGNGGHDLHHRGQLLPDRRGVSQRRRRIPGGEQAPFPGLGMASGCALLVDYVLTISLSIASGTDALFSSLPASWQPFKLAWSPAGRAPPHPDEHARRAGIGGDPHPDIPRLHSHAPGGQSCPAFFVHLPELGAPAHAHRRTRSARPPRQSAPSAWCSSILRAYSMGAGTFTGIEAVSNAMPILREPRVATAKTHDALHGGLPGVSRRGSHDRLSPVRRSPSAGPDPQRHPVHRASRRGGAPWARSL